MFNLNGVFKRPKKKMKKQKKTENKLYIYKL